MRRQASPGFTVVEVMMALAVLTLGAVGVIALQKATLVANTNARNLATATTIAQSWMERMRVDALAWNETGGPAPTGVSDLGNTAWMTQKSTAGMDSDWFFPAAITPATANLPAGPFSSDVMGADQWDGDTMASAFCTQVRLTRFTDRSTSIPVGYYGLIRVEVRVFWDRRGQPVTCSGAFTAAMAQEVGQYGFVYLVSAVSENPSPTVQ